VAVLNNETGEVIQVEVDEVIINHGYDQDAELLKKSKISIDIADDFYVKGTSRGESSVAGIYAAGDIIQYPGKVNLIAGTFQDAANAVNQAKQYIQPDANKFAMVSSHNEVFKERNKKLVKQLV
ncbi:MAG: FAD-dependent oxidoreductase, partial [Psychrobacillus psychrotolerans]